MEFKLEVVTVPVRDIDRSLDFYARACGFALDVDYHPTEDFRVVQLTPAGSACSIQFGRGLTDSAPGSCRSIYLAVTDIEAARRELIEQGVDVADIRRKEPIENWQGDTQAGVDPDRRDYASLASFADPDGNTWVLQEIGFVSADVARTKNPID
jgi:catechol 2,3-dioxygenase-like lactoylglutathione lyase family enzyme